MGLGIPFSNAQIPPTDSAYRSDIFLKSMHVNKVKNIQYKDNVFKLKVDYYLDSIKIKRVAGKSGDYSYQVQSPRIDTLYMYFEENPGKGKYIFFQEFHKRTSPWSKIDFANSSYEHDFKEHEMDLKLHYLYLIRSLELKKFTEPAFIKIE